MGVATHRLLEFPRERHGPLCEHGNGMEQFGCRAAARDARRRKVGRHRPLVGTVEVHQNGETLLLVQQAAYGRACGELLARHGEESNVRQHVGQDLERVRCGCDEGKRRGPTLSLAVPGACSLVSVPRPSSGIGLWPNTAHHRKAPSRRRSTRPRRRRGGRLPHRRLRQPSEPAECVGG